MMMKEIKEDEDIIHRWKELAIESDGEIEKEQDHDTVLNESNDRSNPKNEEQNVDQDPESGLKTIDVLLERIVIGIEKFIGYALQMLKDPERNSEEHRWRDLLERRDRVTASLNLGMKKELAIEIKEDEDIIHRWKELAIESDGEIEKEQDHDTVLNESNDRSNPKNEEQNVDQDPESGLKTIDVLLERIVIGIEKFIGYALQMLKDPERNSEEHRWRDLLERRDRVTASLNLGMKKVNDELEGRLKKDDEKETEEGYYDKLPYISKLFSKLDRMNEILNQCLNLDDIKSEEEGLELCVKILDRSKERTNE